jgi:hypothetical protein
VEFNYFGIYSWGDSDYVPAGANKLHVPDTMGVLATSTFYDYTRADAMSLSLDARLNSVEGNLLYAVPDTGLRGVFGIRFLRFDEDLNLRAYVNDYGYFGLPFAGVPAGYSEYRISTKNELFGIQGGAQYEACLVGRLSFNGVAKMGIYNNNAQQSTYQTVINRTIVARNFNPRQSLTCFAGDFNASLNYHLSGNWMVRCGYSAMIMTGIARATDQLNFVSSTTEGNSIHFGEQVFMHGLNIGFEGRF